MSARRIRVALYSHDAMGIGHLRRNLLIAKALGDACAKRGDELAMLLLVGAREATLFEIPPGADCLALPAIAKSSDGEYHPRSLGVDLEELVQLRSSTIQASLHAFAPDVLIVDKLPRGVANELDAAMQALPPHTRSVLAVPQERQDTSTRTRSMANADQPSGAATLVRGGTMRANSLPGPSTI